jgi:uncharacterized membrane protein (DUF485 family)
MRKSSLGNSQWATIQSLSKLSRTVKEEQVDVSSKALEAGMTALARSRLIVAASLSLAMIAIYFGFMCLFAFAKPILGTMLAPGLSLCILLGPLVIISSFMLCLVYVYWANKIFDRNVKSTLGQA